MNDAFTEAELRRMLTCVQSSLNINMMYKAHLRPGKEETEIAELIAMLQQIQMKLEAATATKLHEVVKE